LGELHGKLAKPGKTSNSSPHTPQRTVSLYSRPPSVLQVQYTNTWPNPVYYEIPDTNVGRRTPDQRLPSIANYISPKRDVTSPDGLGPAFSPTYQSAGFIDYQLQIANTYTPFPAQPSVLQPTPYTFPKILPPRTNSISSSGSSADSGFDTLRDQPVPLTLPGLSPSPPAHSPQGSVFFHMASPQIAPYTHFDQSRSFTNQSRTYPNGSLQFATQTTTTPQYLDSLPRQYQGSSPSDPSTRSNAFAVESAERSTSFTASRKLSVSDLCGSTPIRVG